MKNYCKNEYLDMTIIIWVSIWVFGGLRSSNLGGSARKLCLKLSPGRSYAEPSAGHPAPCRLR
jgi:hypothetical protein